MSSLLHKSKQKTSEFSFMFPSPLLDEFSNCRKFCVFWVGGLFTKLTTTCAVFNWNLGRAACITGTWVWEKFRHCAMGSIDLTNVSLNILIESVIPAIAFEKISLELLIELIISLLNATSSCASASKIESLWETDNFFSKWALLLSINFGMMLSDFLFLLLTPELRVSLAPLPDEGSLLVFPKSSVFSELLCRFASKLSSENSSSWDRLLSFTKSVPAFSLTELLSAPVGIFTAAGAPPPPHKWFLINRNVLIRFCHFNF